MPTKCCACSGKSGHRRRRAAGRRSSSAFRRRRAIPTRRCRRWCSIRTTTSTAARSPTSALMNGTVSKGQKIRFLQAGHRARSARARPVRAAARGRATSCRPGQVGYLICNIKSLDQVHIGDTVTRARRRCRPSRCPATKSRKRMVYCGLYPSDGQDFEELRDALDKLQHQRSELRVRAGNERRAGLRFPLRLPRPAAHGDRAAAAGARGRHRPGADGAERHLRNRDEATAKRSQIHNPQEVPDSGEIEEFRQPIVRVNFVLPTEYIGPVMQLCTRPPRRVRADRVSLADAGDAASTTCRWPK